MKKKVPGRKLPLIARGRDGVQHIKTIRRQTNEQLLAESMNKKGYIRLRLLPQIMSPIDGNFCGWHGGAVTIEVSDPEKAQAFILQFHLAMGQIAKSLNLTARMKSVIS